jgi:hypothetical protein
MARKRNIPWFSQIQNKEQKPVTEEAGFHSDPVLGPSCERADQWFCQTCRDMT